MSSFLSGVPSPRVVSFEEARHIVEKHTAGVCSGETETLDLLAALGRVLAEEIVADRDFPPFARATRDGYAVRSADLADIPLRLAVVGEVKAGDWPEPETCSVGHGQAVGIMTGAPLPAGADAVVMVEHTSVLPDHFVEVRRRVSRGENFVAPAAEASAGEVLVRRGCRLDHAGIAIAASVGMGRVQAFRKPRVAVLSTGDEVVEIGAAPGPAQIRNSNSYSLAAQIQNAGGDAFRLPIAPDERNRLKALMKEGLGYDLLLLTGGVLASVDRAAADGPCFGGEGRSQKSIVSHTGRFHVRVTREPGKSRQKSPPERRRFETGHKRSNRPRLAVSIGSIEFKLASRLRPLRPSRGCDTSKANSPIRPKPARTKVEGSGTVSVSDVWSLNPGRLTPFGLYMLALL